MPAGMQKRAVCRGPSLVLRPRDYVTKLVSSVLTCKLPLDGDPVAVHAASPGPSLLAQASDVSDSAFSYALPGKQTNLDLRLVQPASMLGSVVRRKTLPQPAASFFSKSFHQSLALIHI